MDAERKLNAGMENSNSGYKHTRRFLKRNLIFIILAFMSVLLIMKYFQVYLLSKKIDMLRENAIPNSNENAKVTIVEFSDFECPYCGKAYDVLKQVLATYGNKIELVYKHFPLSFHPNAQKASEASECAKDQNKFWEYHDKLFENQRALDVNSLKRYASELGLNIEKFNACLDSGEKAPIVQEDFNEGKNRGVTGTPTFFINDKMLVGAQPFEAFKQLIEAELAK
jgi:protein-disulfide isomerase